MGTLIDSSVLIAAERGQLDLGRLAADAAGDAKAGEVAIAAITASELLHGVHRRRGAARARAELFVERLLAEVPVIPFDLAVARVYAILSADLHARGRMVGAHDLAIAATAICHGFDVATRDLRSFPGIEGLRVVRW